MKLYNNNGSDKGKRWWNPFSKKEKQNHTPTLNEIVEDELDTQANKEKLKNRTLFGKKVDRSAPESAASSFFSYPPEDFSSPSFNSSSNRATTSKPTSKPTSNFPDSTSTESREFDSEMNEDGVNNPNHRSKSQDGQVNGSSTSARDFPSQQSSDIPKPPPRTKKPTPSDNLNGRSSAGQFTKHLYENQMYFERMYQGTLHSHRQRNSISNWQRKNNYELEPNWTGISGTVAKYGNKSIDWGKFAVNFGIEKWKSAKGWFKLLYGIGVVFLIYMLAQIFRTFFFWLY